MISGGSTHTLTHPWATGPWTRTVALCHSKQSLAPQVLDVSLEEVFGTPGAARVLIAGSSGLGEILQF